MPDYTTEDQKYRSLHLALNVPVVRWKLARAIICGSIDRLHRHGVGIWDVGLIDKELSDPPRRRLHLVFTVRAKQYERTWKFLLRVADALAKRCNPDQFDDLDITGRPAGRVTHLWAAPTLPPCTGAARDY